MRVSSKSRVVSISDAVARIVSARCPDHPSDQLTDFSPTNQLKDHHHYSGDQKNVQQAPRSERSHQPQDPQNQKYDGYGVKHDSSPIVTMTLSDVHRRLTS
jgi:hypothetical protein